MKLILISTSDENLQKDIRHVIGGDFIVEYNRNTSESVQLFSKKRYDYLFIDLDFFHMDSGNKSTAKNLKPFWNVSPDTDIIILAPAHRVREAVELVRAGATDYLTIPIIPEEMKHVLARSEEQSRLKSELNYLRNAVSGVDTEYSYKTNSHAMKEIYNNIRSVAATDSTILITGETGTGKGVIAKLIHQRSKRSENQFISIHCGAIPDTLLESELFGHEKGAFTGAVRRKPGKFEIAFGGTIFLDEIGTISSSMQIKLLQVLQDKIFYRVGGENVLKSDVRIIAATNSDLQKMIREDKFRSDLYYRLNVFQIDMPPLRERMEDIPIFLEQILEKLNRLYSKQIDAVHQEVLEAFNLYEWPGNIRELENLLERAYILENTNVLTPKSFPLRLFKDQMRKYIQPVDITKTLDEIRRIETERVEKEYLTELLKQNKGRIDKTADGSGIGVRQLNKLMTKYKITKENFKK